MFRVGALFFLFLGLAGCGRGPETGQVQQDLASRISLAFGAGTFDIVAVAGRGSSTDITSPPGKDRRIVYYDAELQLARNLDFGGWNTAGAASLVTVLGAGPKGVRGTKAGGNQAGDKIFAHGTAIYERAGETWLEVSPAGFTPPVTPALDTISPPSTSDRLLAALQNVVHTIPAGTSRIDQELSRTVATIQARLTRLSQGYPIAAGPQDGQYARFVQALQTTKPMGLTFQALSTEGSIENLTLLRQETVVLALAQADVAQQALTGEGPFASQAPFTGLRALGSLYPEPMHIIVRRNSSIRTVRDLMHRRIGLGSDTSGTRATAERVLASYRMTAGKDYEVDEAPLSSALSALGSGALDAVMVVIGTPADQIRTAAASLPLRLLPIDESVIGNLKAENSAMLRGVIPKGTYLGVDEDIPTLSVAAVIATTASLGEAEARILIVAIFGNKADLLAAGSPQANQVSAQTARLGLAIPLHSAAEAALSDINAGK